MASTTPLRPLEVPPFTLHALLSPVFGYSVPSAAAQPSSPSRQSLQSTPNRLGQLISDVASAAAGGDASPKADKDSKTGATVTVRSVEAGDDKVYIGASDGRIRVYKVSGDDEASDRALSSPRLGATPGGARATPTSPGLKEVGCTLSFSY